MFITKDDFITADEVGFIKSFQRPPSEEIQNYHIKSVEEESNGWSAMFDISKTDLTASVTRFQGDGTCATSYPDYYRELGHRIAAAAGVSADNMFFQYIIVGPGGKVRKHYDTGVPGYVTYKCNICADGPADDVIYVDKHVMPVPPRSLYCFEANLYKHWMDPSPVTRTHLSYGFVLPCESLGWTEDSPRVRLSNRIWNAYIKNR